MVVGVTNLVCGVNREQRRLYARAKRGVPVYDKRSGQKCKRTNIIGGVCNGKHLAVQCYEHAANAAFFENWFEFELIPVLPERALVIMDNASFHRKQALFDIANRYGVYIYYSYRRTALSSTRLRNPGRILSVGCVITLSGFLHWILPLIAFFLLSRFKLTDNITDLARKYIAEGIESKVSDKRTSNNRRMSFAKEAEFLEQFEELAESGQILTVDEIKKKFDKATGKESHVNTIYCLLKRHGWRKVRPRQRIPEKQAGKK